MFWFCGLQGIGPGWPCDCRSSSAHRVSNLSSEAQCREGSVLFLASLAWDVKIDHVARLLVRVVDQSVGEGVLPL
jgi:hypothetical protein